MENRRKMWGLLCVEIGGRVLLESSDVCKEAISGKDAFLRH